MIASRDLLTERYYENRESLRSCDLASCGAGQLAYFAEVAGFFSEVLIDGGPEGVGE